MVMLDVRRQLTPKPVMLVKAVTGQAAPLKEIGGRWNKKQSHWMLPYNLASIYGMLRMYAPKDIRLAAGLLDDFKTPYGFKLQGLTDSEIIRKAKPWQREALEMMTSSPYPGVLLCLAPGLGKTFTAAVAAHLLKARSVLIVCPVSLIYNWQFEIKHWLGETAFNCHRQGPSPSKWTVTNYNTAVDMLPAYRRPWDIIIIDESIQVQSKDSNRTKAMGAIANSATRRWLLSGSPVARFNDDLYSQFEIIYPQGFTSYWRFAKTYCVVEETQWGDKVIANRRNVDIQKEFRDLMFVRSHTDVKLQTPEAIYETINVDLYSDQRQAFNDLKKSFIAELEGGTIQVTTKLALMTRLQQITSNPRNLGLEFPSSSAKADTLLDLLRMKSIPLPAIIWTHWKAGAEDLLKRLRALKKYSVGYGGSGASEDIARFKDGELDILVMSLGVGKYGHTLTNAQSMVYVDKTWDADAYIQSLARVEGRIGLTHQPYILTLHASGTTDDLIRENLTVKAYNISEVSNANLATLLKGLS